MTEQPNKLDVLERANELLASIRTVDDARHLMARAEAARAYAKEIGLGFEAQNYAAEIKLRTQRKAGQVLDEMTKRGELMPSGGDVRSIAVRSDRLTLSDLNISNDNSHQWQFFYRLPEHVFEEGISQFWNDERELTTWGLYRWGKSYGKPPKDTAGEKKPVPPFVEIKDALATIKENVSVLDAAAKRGDKVADHHLRMLCMALTDLVTDLVEKGYTYEQAATVLETS